MGFLIFSIFVGAIFFPGFAQAAVTWTGGLTGSWTDSGNWNKTPKEKDDRKFELSNSILVFDAVDHDINGLTVKGIKLEKGSNTSLTINDAAGTSLLNVTDEVKVKGTNNTLTLNVARSTAFAGTTKAEGSTSKLVIGHSDALGASELKLKDGGIFETSLSSGLIVSNSVILEGDGGVIGGINDIEFSGFIEGGNKSSLTITNSGTTILSGSSNTLTGTTSVTAGILEVNGFSAGATGAITVATGATLGGSGTVYGETAIAGTLDLNDGLSFDDTLTFTSGSFIGLTLGAVSPMIDFATLGAVTGIANSSLKLTLISGWNPSNTYTLFQNTAASSEFSNLASISFVDADGNPLIGITGVIDGNNFNISGIPEPSSFAMVAGALTFLLVLNRRRLIIKAG